MSSHRSTLYEVWSRADDGSVRRHGSAPGLTFEDACKHLCTESIDFWTHFDRGCYDRLPLFPTEELALGDASPGTVAEGRTTRGRAAASRDCA